MPPPPAMTGRSLHRRWRCAAFLRHLSSAYDVVDVLHPFVLQETLNALQHLQGRQRVEEGGGAHLDGCGPRHEELDGVQAVADAAAAYDRYVDRHGHLAHHAQSAR